MKNVLIFAAIITLKLFAGGGALYAQIPISNLPSTTNTVGAYIPVARNGYNYKIITDSLTNKKVDSLKVSGDTLYYYKNNGTRYFVGVIVGGSGVDTTSLSNRINLKLSIADTAAMLAPYLREVDTASLSSRINLKLNISDTASKTWDWADITGKPVLILGGDTASMLSGYTRVQRFTDSLAAHTTRFNSVTSSLATKLNISDTANMRPRLYAGSNVTITGTYPNLTIASSGGGSSDTSTFIVDTTYNRLAHAISTDSLRLKSARVQLNGSDITPTTTDSTISWNVQALVASDTVNLKPRLSAGSNITITGTYPNLTIAASGGGGGSQTLQQTTDLGDSTTGRLVTSDTAKKYWDVTKSSMTLGDSIPSNKSAIFFGHSVVANVGVSNYWFGFPHKVANQYGWNYYNRGIAGTTVRHWSSNDSCLLDRLYLVPTYSAATHSYIFLNYDINDANSSRGFDTTNYKVDYAKAIDTIVTARGWPTSRVVILSSNYLDTSVTNTYDNIRHFARASRTVAEDKGIKWVDLFYPMEADGGSYYLADEDHPNNAGTTKIAELITKQIPEIKVVGQFVINGGALVKDTMQIANYLRIGTDTVGTSGGTTFDLMITGTATRYGNAYIKNKVYLGTKTDLGSNAWMNLLAQSSAPGITVKDATNAYTNIHADQVRVVNSSGNSTAYIGDGLTIGNGSLNFRGGGGIVHVLFGTYGTQVFNSGQTAGSNFQVKANTDANALYVYGANDNIGSGTATPVASAKLELVSTTKGLLIPRMTTTQRDAISSPAVGLMVYNTTDSAFNYYRLSGWSAIGSGGGGTTYKVGTYNSQTSSVKGAAIVGDSIYMQAFSSGNPGLVPAGGSGTTYLRGDGTWQTISGGTGYVDSVSNNAGGDSLIVVKGSNRYAYKYPAGGSSGITIGTTAITSGTSRHLLFDSTGFVKENSYLQFNTSNQLLLRGGSPGATIPSIAAVNATTTGIELHDATNGVSMNINGTREVAFTSTEIRGDNGMVVGWNNTSGGGAYGGGRNVGITYGADKTIKVVDASTNLGNINTGGLQTNYSAKTTTYTIVSTDYTVTGDATSGAFTITLPTAASVAGKIYVIKKTDASGNAVTVGTTSSQTIDGATTYALATQYKYVTVQSNGSNWFIIGNN